MTDMSLQRTLKRLEYQIAVASRGDRRDATFRLRRTIAEVERGMVRDDTDVEEVDLFDNVPV